MREPSNHGRRPRLWATLVAVGVVLVALGGPAHGQDRADSSQVDVSGSVLVLPNLFYTPETKIAGGLVLGYYRALDPGSPPSSVHLAAIYTQRRQFYVQLQPEAYWRRGQWWLNAELWLSQYPDAFYGIGPTATAADEEEFTGRIGYLDGRLQRQVRAGWRMGPRLLIRTETVTDVAAGGRLDRLRIVGRTGATTLGGGVGSTWDRRDNLYFPREGYMVDTYALLHAVWAEARHTFARGVIDARRYLAVAPGQVLAVQAYAEALLGTAPFQLLPLLGGADRMRGYREGRYRDNVFVAVQGAYRVNLPWRFKGALFANVGQVAPRLNALGPQAARAAVGAGLRVRLTDDGVHGRLDYAVGADGGALYITLLEAF